MNVSHYTDDELIHHININGSDMEKEIIERLDSVKIEQESREEYVIELECAITRLEDETIDFQGIIDDKDEIIEGIRELLN